MLFIVSDQSKNWNHWAKWNFISELFRVIYLTYIFYYVIPFCNYYGYLKLCKIEIVEIKRESNIYIYSKSFFFHFLKFNDFFEYHTQANNVIIRRGIWKRLIIASYYAITFHLTITSDKQLPPFLCNYYKSEINSFMECYFSINLFFFFFLKIELVAVFTFY